MKKWFKMNYYFIYSYESLSDFSQNNFEGWPWGKKAKIFVNSSIVSKVQILLMCLSKSY